MFTSLFVPFYLSRKNDECFHSQQTETLIINNNTDIICIHQTPSWWIYILFHQRTFIRLHFGAKLFFPVSKNIAIAKNVWSFFMCKKSTYPPTPFIAWEWVWVGTDCKEKKITLLWFFFVLNRGLKIECFRLPEFEPGTYLKFNKCVFMATQRVLCEAVSYNAPK